MTETSNHPPQSPRPSWQDQVDLLVERELSSHERQELMRLLDRHPERWRACAMAFIERDLLRQSLRQIHAGCNSAHGELLGRSIAAPPKAAFTDQPNGRGGGGSAATIGRRVTRLVPTAGLWIAAAAILFAASLGIRYSLQGRPGILSPAMPAIAGPTADESTVPIRLAADNPDLWLQVKSAVNGLNVTDGQIIALVEIARSDATTAILPLIQSRTLTQQIVGLQQTELPPAYVDEVQRAGWQLDTAHQFLSFQFPDGRNQVVPVATHNYRYVGRKVF